MPRKPKPRGLPLSPELGSQLGSGQDNAVYDLLHPAEKPHLRVPVGWVVKINHEDNNYRRNRHEDSKEAAWRGIQYKKHKYEILEHFLGEYIPESAFVLTEIPQGGKRRYVEMTLQKKLPQNTLADLTAEQRNDPRLVSGLTGLLKRLQYMYGVLGEVNARTSDHVNLDAKLDLGDISDTVRAETLDYDFTATEAALIINQNKSPNILVDPDSMQIYCIDFDQGQWTEGMAEAKQLAFDIDKRNKVQFDVAAAAIQAA
jgi:hypothetical protein